MGFNTCQKQIICKISEIHFFSRDNPCSGNYYKTKEKEEKNQNGRISNVLQFSISIISGVT